MCFPFAPSSHTVSAVLMARREHVGTGLGLLLSVPQYCWPGETPGWDQKQKLNRQNLTPHACLPIAVFS